MTDSLNLPPPRSSQQNFLEWTPELVNRFWDNISNSRLRELNFSKLCGRSLVVAIEHLLPKESGEALDFGAGDGDLLELMCQRGCRVAAFEPAPVRANKLQDKLSGYDGFLGVVDNKTEQKFDCIVMAEVIEHILEPDFNVTMERVAALTKKGGTVIVTTPMNEDLELNYVYCPLSDVWFHRWQHVRSFTLESLPQTMAQYGIEEVVTHRMDFSEQYFIPYDPIWGGADPQETPPPHIRALRENRTAYCGAQTSILYIGRRV